MPSIPVFSHCRWPRPAKLPSKRSSSARRFCTIYLWRAWVGLKQAAGRKVALEPNVCMVAVVVHSNKTWCARKVLSTCRGWRAKHKRTFSQENILHETSVLLRNQPPLRTNYSRYRKQAAHRKPLTRRPPGLQLHLHQSYASQNEN